MPLAAPALLFALGLALTRTEMLPVFWAAILLLVSWAVLLLNGRRRLAVILLVGVIWGSASLCLDGWRAAASPSWLSEWQVQGQVVMAQSRSRGFRIRLADVVRNDGIPLHGFADLYDYGRARMPQVGQRVSLKARFHVPDNDRNPGAFDYRAWCFDRHIALIGSVRGGLTLLDRRTSWIEQARQRIRAALPRDASAGVLKALLFADRSGVSDEQAAMFSSTGTAHLLAISGLHMGMVASWVFLMVWWLLTRRESWIVRWPVRKTALLAGVVAAAVYGTLAGWPLPAQRAGLMLAGGVLAWLMAARSEPLNTLFAALLLILLLDPASVSSLSLWLSFLATAALLLSVPQRHGFNVQRNLLSLAWISLVCWLVTLPLVVTVFGWLPLYGLPANMLLVPWYGLAVMPTALSGELLALLGWHAAAAWLLSLSGTLIDLGQQMLGMLASLPAGSRIAVAPPLWGSLTYALLLSAAAYLVWRGRCRTAAIPLLLGVSLLMTMAWQERQPVEPTWLVWDVGQGAASSLLMPDGGVLVVDVPGSPGSRFNGGTRVAEGLRALGLVHADALVLSHAQADHLGGAVSLIRRLNELGELWLADVPDIHRDPRVKRIERRAVERHAFIRWLAAGDTVHWHGTRIDILWPPRGYAPINVNNASLVLRVRLPGGQRLLMPGDAESPVESAMSPPGRIDAMLMPHHGSRTSSTLAFVRSLRPAMAIAQTGRGNRYHFPAADVVARYKAVGSDVRNTADGAVILRWPDSIAVPEVRIWSPPYAARRESALKWWQTHL